MTVVSVLGATFLATCVVVLVHSLRDLVDAQRDPEDAVRDCAEALCDFAADDDEADATNRTDAQN